MLQCLLKSGIVNLNDWHVAIQKNYDMVAFKMKPQPLFHITNGLKIVEWINGEYDIVESKIIGKVAAMKQEYQTTTFIIRGKKFKTVRHDDLF
jgi:hypothetical protein